MLFPSPVDGKPYHHANSSFLAPIADEVAVAGGDHVAAAPADVVLLGRGIVVRTVV